LHHKVDKSQEFLKFTEFIGFLGSLMDVEPTLAYLSERVLNDLLKSTNPTLFSSIELYLGYAG